MQGIGGGQQFILVPRRDHDDDFDDWDYTTGQGNDHGPGFHRGWGMGPRMMMRDFGSMGRDMPGGHGMQLGIGPGMMRMMLALMDADGDGTLSLEEFRAGHDRIFRAMDANKDGKLTVEEIEAFVQPGRRSTAQAQPSQQPQSPPQQQPQPAQPQQRQAPQQSPR